MIVVTADMYWMLITCLIWWQVLYLTFNPHNNPMRLVLQLPPFYCWGIWSLQWWNNALCHLAGKCQSGIQSWPQSPSSWHNTGLSPRGWRYGGRPEHIRSFWKMAQLISNSDVFLPLIMQMEPTTHRHEEHPAGTSLFKSLRFTYTFWNLFLIPCFPENRS